METRPEPIEIAFRHVSTSRHRVNLSTTSFEVHRGELYAWLGGPGAGKTAIVDLVLGFDRPDFGTVDVLGLDPASRPREVRSQIGFIDGRGRLPGPMTPVQNLEFLASLTATAPSTAENFNALRLMGLPDRYFDAPIEELPTSAHVLVCLALAYLRRPPLLVLDDPTVGLDSVAAATFIDALAEFRRRGTTILLTTSDVLVAAKVADHVGVMKAGNKVAERHRDQLLQASLTALYADYVGRDHTGGPHL